MRKISSVITFFFSSYFQESDNSAFMLQLNLSSFLKILQKMQQQNVYWNWIEDVEKYQLKITHSVRESCVCVCVCEYVRVVCGKPQSSSIILAYFLHKLKLLFSYMNLYWRLYWNITIGITTNQQQRLMKSWNGNKYVNAVV